MLVAGCCPSIRWRGTATGEPARLFLAIRAEWRILLHYSVGIDNLIANQANGKLHEEEMLCPNQRE